MTAFFSSADIGNRALQHCGATRMDPTLGFNEASVNAAEVSFAYDKNREAELQRRTWTFAIKETFLRAIDTNTMALSPALWTSTTTYYRGSIVSDQSGNLWISTITNNLNNDPLLTNYWEPYYGPIAVPLYDTSGTTQYNAGEIIYTTIGDGTYRVFLSLISANGDDPTVQTIWSSKVTYYQGQTVTFYPTWLVGTTYALGSGVTLSGVSYVSLAGSNVGNNPSTDTTHWMPLTLTATGVVQAPEWNIATAYAINAIVSYNGTLYIAGASSTGAIPSSSPSSWTAFSGGVAYQSLIDLNINNEPDTNSAANWSSLTTYSTGQTVTGSDGVTYTSKSNSNLNNNPITDGGAHWTAGGLTPWTSTFTGGSGSVNWLEIGGAEFPGGVSLTNDRPIYPVGAGPLQQTFSRNAYRLPAGYLRRAPKNPKLGTIWGGAPSGNIYDDWMFENKYLTTFDPGPIKLRFVANVTDVRRMHTMFCEGLAARIAFEVCPKITQSDAKREEISKVYNKWMGEARTVNAIEQGTVDPPDDDFISCRY